jgi:hypothetical protein
MGSEIDKNERKDLVHGAGDDGHEHSDKIINGDE